MTSTHPGDELKELEDEEEEYDEDALPCPHCLEAGCEICNYTGYLVIPVGGAVCPYCGGSGQVGSFVMEQQCPACSGMGAVDADRLLQIESGNWTEQYTSIGAALENQGTCRADELNPDFLPFVDQSLYRVDFVDQDVSGQDFTNAFHDDAVAAAHADQVDYALVDGKLTIVSKPVHSFIGTNFTGAILRGVSLGGCDFSRAIFRNADLAEASLPAARMEGADLTGANLTGASLKGALLRNAVLRRANLQNIDLSGASLISADLTDSNIETAGSLDGTQLFGSAGLTPEQQTRCQSLGAIFFSTEQLPPWHSS